MTDRHQAIKNILEKQLENGRLAHAYLFAGPKGTGKKALALEFARKIIDTGNLSAHPDYFFLDCAQDASAESVREFIGRIFLKPFLAKRKFALLSNIENLNIQGANALLKTLEEPPQSTVIVLTADTRKILPTIISRCQVFSFNRLVASSSNRITTPPLDKLEGPLLEKEGIAPQLIDFTDKPLAERLLAINGLADLEEAELKSSIEDFIYESATRLSSAPEKYIHLATGLKAYEDLNTNKNRKLILQGLLTKI